MHHRFQIEDLIDQNEAGVVFRAVDTETGNPVALRRFFPFGPNGGGLSDDEQASYQTALARLADVRHAALRSIIAGGCDPVDGMPFIATEWVEGGLLGETLANGPLPAEMATRLLTDALEASERISRVFGEEAVWVDTALDSIVVRDDPEGAAFTFWMSPIRWLGNGSENSTLSTLVQLAEDVMHWHGLFVADHAGHGLGGWLKWLRAAPPETSLRDASEKLAAAVRQEPVSTAGPATAAARPTPPHSARPKARLKQSSAAGIWWVAAALACIAAALGWLILRRPAKAPAIAATSLPAEHGTPSSIVSAPPPPAAAPSRRTTADPPVTAKDDRMRRVLELNQQLEAERAKELALLTEQRAALERQGGVFHPDQVDVLNAEVGNEVRLEGVVDRLEKSKTGKTIYLMFRENSDKTAPRGAVELSKVPDLDEPILQTMVGKKLRIQGRLESRSAGRGLRRPEVRLTGRSGIEELAD